MDKPLWLALLVGGGLGLLGTILTVFSTAAQQRNANLIAQQRLAFDEEAARAKEDMDDRRESREAYRALREELKDVRAELREAEAARDMLRRELDIERADKAKAISERDAALTVNHTLLSQVRAQRKH